MLGNDVSDVDFSPRCGYCDHEGACLDHVGDNRIGASVKLFYSADLDHTGTRTCDVGTAGVKEVGKVDNMRFTSSIVDNGHSVGKNRGENDIDRGTHRRYVKIHHIAHKTVICRCVDVAVFYGNGGSESLESLYVKVDGTNAEVTAAGPTDLRFAKATKLRADEIGRGTHFSHEVVRRRSVTKHRSVDFHRVLIFIDHRCTHFAKDLKREGHIADRRKVFDGALAFGKDGGKNNGKCCVFHPIDENVTIESIPTIYNNSVFADRFRVFKQFSHSFSESLRHIQL